MPLVTINASDFTSVTTQSTLSASATTTSHPTTTSPYSINYVTRKLGDTNVPAEIRRRRRWVTDAMRRVGTPVLIKNRFTDLDVRKGVATHSVNYEGVYGQTRKSDPISHGVGFVSVETSPDEWISPDGGSIVVAAHSPGAGYEPAPKYRGYGPGYLTYIVMPDVAIDWYTLSTEGAIMKRQDARAVMAWFPEVNDNDLMITVTLDNSNNLIETNDRYELKQKTPVTMRGHDRKGRLGDGGAAGNRYVVNQMFQLGELPPNHSLYRVETDR